MFSWFFGKKEAEKIKEDTKKGFESVKKDINSVSGWIKHLDSEKHLQKKEIEDLKEVLSSVQKEPSSSPSLRQAVCWFMASPTSNSPKMSGPKSGKSSSAPASSSCPILISAKTRLSTTCSKRTNSMQSLLA